MLWGRRERRGTLMEAVTPALACARLGAEGLGTRLSPSARPCPGAHPTSRLSRHLPCTSLGLGRGGGGCPSALPLGARVHSGPSPRRHRWQGGGGSRAGSVPSCGGGLLGEGAEAAPARSGREGAGLGFHPALEGISSAGGLRPQSCSLGCWCLSWTPTLPRGACSGWGSSSSRSTPRPHPAGAALLPPFPLSQTRRSHPVGCPGICRRCCSA